MRFEVRPGDYRISAGKTGYVVLGYGQQRALERGRVVTIRACETLEKIDITLLTSGAISGRVVDEGRYRLYGVPPGLTDRSSDRSLKVLSTKSEVGSTITVRLKADTTDAQRATR